MPTATPPDQVQAVLAEAVARPTLGARQLVDHLADRGVRLSPSGVQKLLVRHRLGRRTQRVAALAQLTAATTGILTKHANHGPFGSATSRPARAISSPWTPSTSASPEGIGPVWQLTAVDTATRDAIGKLVAGDKSARDAAAFVDHVAERLAGIGAELTGVLTDNGPEFTGHQFTAAMAERGLRHHRIPPRSPNHNAVCERFQGTASRSSTGPPSTASTCSPGRPGRPVPGLVAARQHPPPQPRRLHARPHALCGHGGAPIMTTPRVHLSPQPVLRKT